MKLNYKILTVIILSAFVASSLPVMMSDDGSDAAVSTLPEGKVGELYLPNGVSAHALFHEPDMPTNKYYNYNMTSGSLPTGMSISGYTDPSGSYVKISGTPTTSGTYNFSLYVKVMNNDKSTKYEKNLDFKLVIKSSSVPESTKITVYFNAKVNGGNTAGVSSTIEKGGTIAPEYKNSGIPFNQINPANKDGHSFVGWFTSATGGTKIGYDTVFNSGCTIYAQFALSLPSEWTHVVSYDANGGTGAPADQTVVNNSKSANIQISSTEPTKSGFLFAGWTLIAEDNPTLIQPGDLSNFTTASASGSTTTYVLRAVWEAENLHYVYINYHVGGGETAIAGHSVNSASETMSVTLSSSVPVKNGSKFLGWSLDPTGGPQYQPGQVLELRAGNYVLHPVWEAKDITITFDSDGGEGKIDPIVMKSGSNIVLPFSGFTMKYDDDGTEKMMYLSGWVLPNSMPSGTIYVPGVSYVFYEDTTLVAYWTLEKLLDGDDEEEEDTDLSALIWLIVISVILAGVYFALRRY